jgi:uncharacterized protein YjbI with pentapeptide repeats
VWEIVNGQVDKSALRYADLRNADLRKGNLQDVDLRGTDLRGTFLDGADLTGADLRGTDLSGPMPYGVKLRDNKYDENTQWPEDFDPKAHGGQYMETAKKPTLTKRPLNGK